MSSIFRIKENMEHLTSTEQRIAEYIMANKEKVLGYSALELGEAVNASAAAVIRFSKKIGYDGFTHFKVELARDRSDEPTNQDFIDKLIESTDTAKDILLKNQMTNHITFENTYKLLDANVLDEVIEKVYKARRIYIFGIGGSGIIAEDLYQKFVRVDRDVYYFTDYHLSISSLSNVTKEDVVISFSYSGTTREIVLAQEIAQSLGATTIAITQVGKNYLSKISDYVINIPKEEQHLRLGSISSRYSMFAVSDVIYLGVVRHNIEGTRNQIVRSRANVLNINKK